MTQWFNNNGRGRFAGWAVCSVVMVTVGCFETHSSEDSELDLARAGGGVTVTNAGTQAFSQPLPGLSDDELEKHQEGDALFETPFVSAGAKPVRFGGLGPYFNAVSCAVCHPVDGRSPGPLSGKNEGFFLKLSMPGDASEGAPAVDGFGTQLFDLALFGLQPMGKPSVEYRDSLVQLAEGEWDTLKVPSYAVEQSYRALPANVLLSPRVAPMVFGQALLEAIPESDILAGADPDDRDGDGISGRVQWVQDHKRGVKAVGRFALKGENPTVEQQVAGALHGDMGLTNPIFRTESVAGTPLDPKSPDTLEVGDSLFQAMVFYVRSLAVPERRPISKAGYDVFVRMECAKCHTPEQRSGEAHIRQASQQKFAPFTDLLLHDMGAGLADQRPSFKASGSEWKTPPLWGLGLLKVVNGHEHLLHDGRARGFQEAILWHSGEAESAKEKYRKAAKTERRLLLDFLQSL